MFCAWPINREVRIFLKRTHTFFTSQLKNANKWNYKGTFLRMIKYLFWCNIFRFMDYNIWLYCIGIFCLKTFFTFAQCFLLRVVVPLNLFFFFICNNCFFFIYIITVFVVTLLVCFFAPHIVIKKLDSISLSHMLIDMTKDGTIFFWN